MDMSTSILDLLFYVYIINNDIHSGIETIKLNGLEMPPLSKVKGMPRGAREPAFIPKNYQSNRRVKTSNNKVGNPMLNVIMTMHLSCQYNISYYFIKKYCSINK